VPFFVRYNPPRMRSDTVFRILFVVYCVEAGVFLILAPWGPMWARTLSHLPLGFLGPLLLHPLFRGAVSGFGLVHLVWGANDLQALLGWRRRT
jgi:hypothetical protein